MLKQSPTERLKCVGVCGKLRVIIETKSNKCSDLKQSNRERKKEKKRKKQRKDKGSKKEITRKKENIFNISKYVYILNYNRILNIYRTRYREDSFKQLNTFFAAKNFFSLSFFPPFLQICCFPSSHFLWFRQFSGLL